MNYSLKKFCKSIKMGQKEKKIFNAIRVLKSIQILLLLWVQNMIYSVQFKNSARSRRVDCSREISMFTKIRPLVVTFWVTLIFQKVRNLSGARRGIKIGTMRDFPTTKMNANQIGMTINCHLDKMMWIKLCSPMEPFYTSVKRWLVRRVRS